ncbi:MAG: PQQ-binding-like beta-propeller repeat protein [Deltaproteobacteria bacterium]
MAILASSGRIALAQALVVGNEDETTENKGQHPFLLPAQPTEIGEAMEDFRRFAGRKQWEKAFKHLEKVFNATSNGLVLTADGIMLPSRMIAREALLELPPAGQDAYRLFFDAEARKLLEQAQGAEELNKLTQIFSRFLVTSVGDTAADRLGDLHFETGNFAQAVNAWRSILEQRPDSRISRARLRVKIGVGLARQQHGSEFRELLKVVEEQHAGEKLTLGGREVSAADYLRGMAERNKGVAAPATAQSPGGPPADIPLSGDPQPLWQFQFFPPADGQPGNQPGLRMQQMWGPTSISDLVPPVVADQSRLYANLLGYDLGIDLENGKLLWRSGRFFDVPQKAQQGGLTHVEQFGVAAGAGRTWSVAIDTRNQNQNQNQGRQQQGGAKFEIVAREADTGKQVFSSQQSTELKEWSLRGSPLLVGERVYVAASKVNQPRKLDVLALSAKDGKLVWSSVIGNYTTEQNSWYGAIERGNQPSLLFHDGRLYVDSHSGSLVQLDAASGQIEWGLNYSSETTQMSRFWSPWGMRTEQFTVSPPQMVNGVLFVKGMRSRRLYAVDPVRPKVLWHRPVPRVATLIGIDEGRFYLGGEDISAFDLATRKILWSVKVNLGTTWARPLLTQGRIYHFSSRGIFEIDKADGHVVHLFRGADLQSLGGELLVTPKALLAVSNLAVTAYPLNGGSAASNESTTGGAATAAQSGGETQ